MDIISKEEEVEGRHFKRSKDKFGYKIPNVSLDKDICVNIKYYLIKELKPQLNLEFSPRQRV